MSRVDSFIEDSEIDKYWSIGFETDVEYRKFKKAASKSIKKRRPIYILSWYLTLANQIDTLHHGYDPLKIMFLFFGVEAFTKLLNPNIDGPFKRVSYFFKYITSDDKKLLRKGFRKIVNYGKTYTFNQILEILYEVRNQGTHGGNFFEFFLNDKSIKDLSNSTTITQAYFKLKKKKFQRTIHIDVGINFADLQEIIINSAVAYYKDEFDIKL